MIISAADWTAYVNKLARVNSKAAELMQAWIDANGTDNINALFEYAYALSTKYGEAAASLACEMYDSIASAQGASVPPALPAETAKIGEVKHLVGKALQKSPNLVSPEVGKMVKQAGADTMLHNAARDGAEWAWVPHGGETCAFCITLASKGWQAAGKTLLYNHAEHIHANCRCEFAIRHDGKSGVQGYDPQKYLDMYNGDTIDDDIIGDIHDKYGYGDAKTRQMAIRRQLVRENKANNEDVRRDEYKANNISAVSEKERLKRSYLNSVQIKAFDAPGFVEKFEGITGNKSVDKAIYESAIEILDHRKNTYFEDIYFLDATTGDIIHKLTTCNEINGVTYDDETNKAIEKAHKEGRKILTIHNHPGGLPPTLDDGVSALNHDYVDGIVIGHNLEVFRYGKTNISLTPEQCEKIHKALSESLRFEVDFDDKEWYDVLKRFGMEVERR